MRSEEINPECLVDERCGHFGGDVFERHRAERFGRGESKDAVEVGGADRVASAAKTLKAEIVRMRERDNRESEDGQGEHPIARQFRVLVTEKNVERSSGWTFIFARYDVN